MGEGVKERRVRNTVQNSGANELSECGREVSAAGGNISTSYNCRMLQLHLVSYDPDVYHQCYIYR